MSLPVIAITVDQTLIDGIKTNSLSSAYSKSVISAGGTPLLIPNELPIGQISSLIEMVDGILFSGGGDIDIKYSNSESHPEIGDPSEDRDAMEIALCKKAIESRLPILGICRGIQVINVALGGTLLTHIPDQFETTIEHNTPDAKGRNFIAHDVKIEPHTKLAGIFQKSTIPVNSFHHQAIKDLAPGLKVTAWATDGLIEAIEIPGDSFSLIGVQWHPECIQEKAEQQQLFKAFIAACTR